jgi:hypothetical protein
MSRLPIVCSTVLTISQLNARARFVAESFLTPVSFSSLAR